MERAWRRSVLAGLAGLLAVGVIGATQPGVLAKLVPGQWQLKEIDGAERRALCVTDPAALLQVIHPRTQCTRAVIESTPSALTVHYTCPGAGHGRSTLTLRSGTSGRLHTQGIAGGAPFNFEFDARRTGDCGAALTGQ